ncbi:B3 domain-containing protein Os07g0563300-like isoform X1 [Salvia hispanica]|uniref:B3 domain-containing protein Os07g0563300-like isoform X1 n=2 Tax=Salvia hispanica TaxID=49212 RepID=UPI00200921B6|nr:B3 domain-containing protein Os07g0563300-like isoform X1 [Salvia hispanica]
MSATMEVCFNSNCRESSEKWKRGWRRRTGEYAHLCDPCASAYEDGKFCETFHTNASGWRCCESCGKQIHCGCIVSFHMFVLLDAGGIECLTCAKKSYMMTPNPAWPPPLHFLPSHPERMKDISMKTWSGIAASGPVPWHQAPSLFNGPSIQANDQLKMPFEVDVSDGIGRYGLSERLSMASPEMKQERSCARLANGKMRFGPPEILQNGNIGFKVKEQHCPFTSDFKPIYSRNDTSSNQSLGVASSSKNETDDAPISSILSQSPSVSITVGKQVFSSSGLDSCGEGQIRDEKSRGDVRSRNQLLPRYRPQITNKELQKISGDLKCITPLFEKMLSASDAGRIGRLVLPKKCAEAYFPSINQAEGLPLNVQDIKGKEWVFQFRFWPNNNSRMYVLEGITPCIQSMQLQAGDVVTFSRLEPEGKLIMGGRKASVVPSFDQGEVNVIGSETSSPGDANARNKSADIVTVNGHMKEKVLEDKHVIPAKRKNNYINAKSKRLRIENEDMMELKLTYKEAQSLIRAPEKSVPSSCIVDGCEFEEFEECEPVIGRPTLFGIDHSGEKIQWVQCEDCLKWRKVPANALVPSNWTCSDNAWDLHRSTCSSAEELTNVLLKQLLPAMNKDPRNKEESSERDADVSVAVEGHDTLANSTIQGEGKGLIASSENRTKHPCHRPGCTCIVCLQPPSGKGTKHGPSCDCGVCTPLRFRFRTLMERLEKKQTEPSSSSQNSHEKELDVDACVGSSTVKSSLNVEEVPSPSHVEEPKGRISSASPLKGQIDLNIQPEREEDFSPRSDCGVVKYSQPGSSDRFFRQQQRRSLESDVIGNLLGKQDGVGCVNIIGCVALDKESG